MNEDLRVVRDLVEAEGDVFERACALSTMDERTLAIRILRRRRSAEVAELDQVEAQLRALERRHPGIGDDAA